jgi:hypothetical protein
VELEYSLIAILTTNEIMRFLRPILNNNTADESGGAFEYNFKRPKLENNTYANNTALYGANIASYPIKIRNKSDNQNRIELNNVGSGVPLNESLVLQLLDYDNQTMILDNISQIKIIAIVPNTNLGGTHSVKVRKGEATFSNIQFQGIPGDSNIDFQSNSKAIDQDKVNAAFGSKMDENKINVSFRYWQPGEAVTEIGTCEKWSPGTYSLEWNSTKWEDCVDNAVWLGGTEIRVNDEYWRLTKNSTKIIECPNKSAWLGGYSPEKDHPVDWDAAYSGLLWTNCKITETEKYEKISDFKWSKCPNPAVNAFKVIGIVLLLFAFLMVLIIINIRKTKESQLSILMRIFTNYLQLISATLSFNLRYPRILSDIFYPVDKIGSSSDTFLSFDCFVEDFELRAFAPSNQIFKIFLMAFLPIILFGVVAAVWVSFYIIFNRLFNDLRRVLIVSLICILFIIHPTITRSSYSLFQCIEVDDNELRMRVDLDIKWYSSTHRAWAIALGFPIIIVWVFGTPLVGLIILIRERHNLHKEEVKKYLMILYQGLREETFYWEFINTLRKILIVATNTVLATFNGFYRIVVSIVILITIIRIQKRIKPYK